MIGSFSSVSIADDGTAVAAMHLAHACDAGLFPSHLDGHPDGQILPGVVLLAVASGL